MDTNTATIADPLANYLGSKAGSGVAARVISEMPPHDCYAELFAGSARVARLKRPARENLLTDCDPETCKKLKALNDDNLTFFEIRCMTWMKALEHFAPRFANPNTLLYLDPPYPACVRGRDRYKHDMRNDDHHRTMLLRLRSLKSMVIVSSYANEIYDGILADWRRVEIPTMTRGGKRVEVIWCNFEKPTYLHDPRFAGKNHRARWRIEKVRRRWREKYLALPPAERQLMFETLFDADDEVAKLHHRQFNYGG